MLNRTLCLLFLSAITSLPAFAMDLPIAYSEKNTKKEIVLQIDPSATVAEVKQKIFEEKNSKKFEVSNQIISYRPFSRNERQNYVIPDDDEDLFELTGNDCSSDIAYFADECEFSEPLRLEFKENNR